MRHAVEKTFLAAQPVQPVALTSAVACYQSAINKWRPQSTAGILTSLLKTVQSGKTLLPMYLSEGGMASSTWAAQFMKALTRIAWRVVGRRTSLRLVQCTKANSGISSTLVLQRSTLLSSRQLSHACAPIATKCLGRASAMIPVELRQPGVNSLVLACSTDSRGDGSSLKVTSARLIHP